MSATSTGTIVYPRSQPRSSARPAARAGVSRTERTGSRAVASGRSRGSARSTRRPAAGHSAATRARGTSAAGGAAERVRRGVKWGREDALGFVSRHKAPLVAALVVLLAVAFFYGPAKGLYQAWRTEGSRQAELAALNESNEGYQSDIDRLQTREGIEDEARRRGYVAEGETSIVVEGLDAEGADDAAPQDDTPWYLGILDTVFQYEGE